MPKFKSYHNAIGLTTTTTNVYWPRNRHSPMGQSLGPRDKPIGVPIKMSATDSEEQTAGETQRGVKLDSYLSSRIKINSKRMKDLHVKTEVLK